MSGDQESGRAYLGTGFWIALIILSIGAAIIVNKLVDAGWRP